MKRTTTKIIIEIDHGENPEHIAQATDRKTIATRIGSFKQQDKETRTTGVTCKKLYEWVHFLQ